MGKSLRYIECCYMCKHWLVSGDGTRCTITKNKTGVYHYCINYEPDHTFIRGINKMATPEQIESLKEPTLTKEDYRNDYEH